MGGDWRFVGRRVGDYYQSGLADFSAAGVQSRRYVDCVGNAGLVVVHGVIAQVAARFAGNADSGVFDYLGALAILPLYVYESVTFQTMPVTAVSVASIAYVAVFPSLLSYMFWNHATQKLGVNRTGQFSHLMPVFGILLATLLLGERLQLYHALGMLLVAAGLVLTNKITHVRQS